ncbi:hypothetical protein [Prosthecobacter sp.]|uniref:DNA polymerase III subunit beta family protein n=1 Tax=Prosthecobacter sp. TaxID=1965333 RepID=UPI0037CC00C4
MIAEIQIVLNKALLRALCALVSTDETRHIINGLYFETIGTRLVCVATNGRMLTVVDVSHIQNILPPDGLSVIVPKPRLLPEKLEEVEDEYGNDCIAGEESELRMILRIRGDQVFWQDYDGLEITAPLIEGKFPDWRKVLEITRDATGEPVVPANLNPSYFAHATAVVEAWLISRSNNSGVSLFPARGDVLTNGCPHVFRPSTPDLRDGVIVLLMPMRAKDGIEKQFNDIVPSWMVEKKGGES